MIVALSSNAQTSGWGVLSAYLTKELSKLSPIPDSVALHAATPDLMPLIPAARGKINIGYTFFEAGRGVLKHLDNAAWFSHIICGSTWCEKILRDGGLNNVSTIIQGVDPALFYPRPKKRDNKFVVGSFGKFEYRKGQDLVIRAVAEMMKRHNDVWLSAVWYNQWGESMNTMVRSSPYLVYDTNEGPSVMSRLWWACKANGIDMNRTMLHPLVSHQFTPDLYRECDIVLFPNRCEGGTNLCLMEAIACGVTPIFADTTGQEDIGRFYDGLSAGSCMRVSESSCRSVEYKEGQEVAGVWPEPTIEALIGALEYQYDRWNDGAWSRNSPASEKMRNQYSWAKVASRFHAEVGRWA